MISVSLSTGSLYTYGIARVFELAADAGFDAVEILIDARWDTRQGAHLRQLSEATGLPISAVHSPFAPFVPGWPYDAVERLRESAAVARLVGADVVVAHLPLRIWLGRLEIVGLGANSSKFPIFLPTRRGYRRFLQEALAPFEAAEGVRVGVENMPIRRVLGIPVEIYALNDLDALARMPHLTLDTTHLGTKGLDPLLVYERVWERVVHVHLSNYNGQEHRLPHDGHLPLARLLQTLAQHGYAGAVSLEVGPEVLHAEDEAQVRSHLRGVVDFCRLHLGISHPQPAGRAEP